MQHLLHKLPWGHSLVLLDNVVIELKGGKIDVSPAFHIRALEHINDNFGHPVQLSEWFLVPLLVIDEAVAPARELSAS